VNILRHFFFKFMKNFWLKSGIIVFIVLIFKSIYSQEISVKINWLNNSFETLGNNVYYFMQFEGGTYLFPGSPFPIFSSRYPVQQHFNDAQIKDLVFETVPVELLKNIPTDELTHDFQFNTSIFSERKRNFLHIELLPVRKNTNGKIERLTSFTIAFLQNKDKDISPWVQKSHVYASNSVLSTGKWKQIKITQTGIYKITYNQLVNMGFSNPENIRIYGNAGRPLPFNNNGFKIDDLAENPIYMNKGPDYIFNEGDYILFYAHAPVFWNYDTTNHFFIHTIHPYADESIYFLTDGYGVATPINNIDENLLVPQQTVTSFDDYAYHELELVNFIMSGRMWVGETFDYELTKTFSFNFPNTVPNSDTKIKCMVYAESSSTSSFTFSLNGVSLGILGIASGTSSTPGTFSKTVSNSNSQLSLGITYNKPAQDGTGWLDYFDINVKRNLIFTNGQMLFRNIESVSSGNIVQYQMTGANANVVIWDVTNPVQPKAVQTSINGNTLSFIARADSLREYIAFDGSNFYSPIIGNDVPNQNLHALSNPDMVIVSHPNFLTTANELAEWHRQKDGLSVVVVTPQQIYNEFSSGMVDASAIKFFLKMMYDRANADSTAIPKYLLLFGDGSFDNRHVFSQNSNFIPTYESPSSTSLQASLTTDDYFVMLDDNEYEYIGDVDMGVGRITVKTLEEANHVVNKIKNYYAVTTQGDWRNWVTFVADDEDANEHISNANDLATYLDTTFGQYNLDKIYLDAYLQQSTPTGDQYPDVKNAIAQRMQKGSFVFNFTGHGNEYGLTAEHVIIVSDINAWTNFNTLPLFITATCEFSRWDNYNRTSGGEDVLLNPNGGAVTLFSTTRLVYSASNFVLNKFFFTYLFPTNAQGEYLRLGDVYRLAKNHTGGAADVNKRNFSLLGDPALKLVFPKYNVFTDSINGVSTVNNNDTIHPLQKVIVKGHIENNNHTIVDNYNGTLIVTIFDKPVNKHTLANDGGYPFSFKVQNNVLFKGKVSVINGYFSFNFIMPKDILYTSGFGKISYYAYNETASDANGFNRNLQIGGDPCSINDTHGPTIQLYLNDEKFVSGENTNESPKLIAKLYDENGINTVSSSIGHDITACLDNNSGQKIVLNDYYVSEKDNYQKGVVQYPFSNLSAGEHKLTVKAWDVADNSSEASISFTVKPSENISLSHVLNYPNPFSTITSFYFEHNQISTPMDVLIQIFTLTGKVVKNIHTTFVSEGFRSIPISWDGRDEYGDKLAQGVYFYRIQVKTSAGEVEKFEKLVILK